MSGQNQKEKAKSARLAAGSRKTTETEIELKINIDGSGESIFNTEITFFEHMLGHVSRHGLIDINLQLRGDTEIDCHHSVEDTAILFGSLFQEALGDKTGISRYGHFTLTMDEVLVTVAVDIGGRYNFTCRDCKKMKEGKFGIYDAELTLEFLEKFAMNAKINLHVLLHYGENRHHIHEAVFKALGRALRMAATRDERMGQQIPSTKGTIE